MTPSNSIHGRAALVEYLETLEAGMAFMDSELARERRANRILRGILTAVGVVVMLACVVGGVLLVGVAQ